MSIKQTKISKSARGKACTARIQGAGPHDPATTVLAHAPFSGKFGSRSQWWWGAYLCVDCHDILDRRSNHVSLTLEEETDFWYRAVHETQEQLFADNLLKVV